MTTIITQPQQTKRVLPAQNRQQLLQQWRKLPPKAIVHIPQIIRLGYEPAIYPEDYTLYRVELGYYHYEYRVEWWLVKE